MVEAENQGSRASTIIIGGGVSGLSVAFELLRRGCPATLLERGELGRESSWAGGGILSPLLPWDYSEPLVDLALRSMHAFEGWVGDIEARSGRIAEFWRCGMRISGLPRPEAALDWCQAHGLEASLDPASPDRPLWLPGIAQVRNPRLVEALRTAVLALGGTIHAHSEVQSAETQPGRISAVRTPNGTFAADRFVIATGAWAGLPMPGLAGVPNIKPIRGQMVLYKLAPGALDRILFRNGLYLIPRRDGHVLAGSTLEDAGFDKTPDDSTFRRLHADAAALLPLLGSAQPVRHWAGLRPGSPENLPIIDRHPEFGNVYVNAGHYRYGVTLAPASAELLVDLMEGRTPALDATPYSWQGAQARSWNAAL